MEEIIQKPDLHDAEPLDIARQAALLLLKEKAMDLKMFHVATKTVIADYYVIVSGRSSTHVRALAYKTADKMQEFGLPAAHIEGEYGSSWILVDLGSVIVHVFDTASRGYYHLERLLDPEGEIGTSDLEGLADEGVETI